MPGINNTQKAIRATKSTFLVCGLGISSWAPMVPYVKERLQLNDANLGVLLLFLGAGAIIMMPVSGLLAKNYGSRKVIFASSILMALTLPLLLETSSPVWVGVVLFVFGSGVGMVDAAMNAHGVQVQNVHGKPVMSSFHGLYSVGGLLGALGIGFLMSLGLKPVVAAMSISVMLILITCLNYDSLFNAATEKRAIDNFSSHKNAVSAGSGSWLNGKILFLGALCFVAFLSEGAVLDWSAVFLRENRGINEDMAGIGYAAFSVAMAVMRLSGDRLVSKLNGKRVVVAGSMVAALGLVLIIFTPWITTGVAGFILWGLGAANIVPIFFSEGGRLKEVPSTIAIPAITTMGYAGIIAGPAILGFVAHHFSLPAALELCGVLLLLIAVIYPLKSESLRAG